MESRCSWPFFANLTFWVPECICRALVYFEVMVYLLASVFS